MISPIDTIVGGLDCWYAAAVLDVLSGMPALFELEEYLQRSVELKACTKLAFVNKAIRDYRAELTRGGGDPPVLVLDTLAIVEEHNGKIGCRKLLERVRREIFELRQLRLPGT